MFGSSVRIQAKPVERRRHQRVNVQLTGRYMLESRREFPCQTVNMSPGGVAVLAPSVGVLGERVIIYIDQIGRVEGKIVRHIPNGFAISFSATVRKRDKLASQLTWLANRHILGLPEDRRHDRIQPRNPRTILTLPGGNQIVARLIDASTSGAGISTDVSLDIGLRIIVGKLPATIVRKFEGGIAVEFGRTLTEAEIDSDVCVSL
ncbi:MAG: PilZ domain-containing protein [Beijerinckiaceae bacterium]